MTANTHFHLPKPEPYQRLGSGDGEGLTLLTRQIAHEPLPASVLFGLGCGYDGAATVLIDMPPSDAITSSEMISNCRQPVGFGLFAWVCEYTKLWARDRAETTVPTAARDDE